MRTYKIGVCDRDPDYTVALMDYAASYKDSGLQIIAFSNMESVRDYLDANDLDMVLTSDLSGCEMTERGISISDVRVVVLSEYMDMGDALTTEEGPAAYIFKYQKVRLIFEQLRKLICDKTQDSRYPATTLGVYSPIGRCGKTRLARALAEDDEVRGGLYVAMEDWSENINALDSSILYQIRTRAPEMEQFIKSRIMVEGRLHVLYLSGTYLDTQDISSKDIEELMRILLGFKSFTTIVFDIGCAAIRDMNILSLFDRLYMPVLRDEKSKRKLEVHSKMLKELGMRQLLTKIIPVDVPDVEAGSEQMTRAIWKMKNNE